MFKNLLKTFRKREKLLLFGLLVLVTLGFGVTGTMLGVIGGRQNTEALAGEICGKQISNREFDSTKYRWKEWIKFQEIFAYRAYYFWLQNPAPYDMIDLVRVSEEKEEETTPSDELKELTWAVLLLKELADRAKINVEETEVRQLIKAFFTPQDREANQQQIYENYQWFLRKYLQISETEFEKTMFEFLKINKYRKLIDAAVIPNLEELYQAYRDENEEVAVKYVVFYPDEFTDRVKTNLGEVKTYFYNNVESYQVPEKYQIEYLLTENEALLGQVIEPDQTALQNYYNQHLEDYKIIALETPEEISPTVTTTPVYKPLGEVHDEIKQKLMDEAAKDLGLDKMTKIGNEISELYLQDKTIALHDLAQKNNLKYEVSGFFNINQINELEKNIGLHMDLGRQIQSFQENEISDINSTSKGYIIFRLLKKQPAYTPKLTAQLKEKVLRDIRRFKAIDLAKESAHDLIKEITTQVKEETQDIQDKPEPERREHKNEIRLKCFNDIVTQNGLKYHETAYFTKKEPIADLAKAGNEFKQTAFKLEPGDYTTVLDNDAYYVIQLTQRRVASGEGFDEQKPYLTSQVKQKKHKEFLRQWTKLVKKEAHFKRYTSATPDKQ